MLKAYFLDLVSVYTTTRLIQVKSQGLAVTSFIFSIIVLLSYIASIQLDYRRLYQSTCPVKGVVASEVKGYATTKHLSDSNLDIENPELYRRIWDETDLVMTGPDGEGGVTIVTNMKITANQTIGTCSAHGDASGTVANCVKNGDCVKWAWGDVQADGVLTGKCNKSSGTCATQRWCPSEDEKLPRQGKFPLLDDVVYFTIFLKNAVEFPGCSNEHGSNLGDMTSKYVRDCLYDLKTDRWCPRFKLCKVLNTALQDYPTVAVMGAAIQIRIIWNCNFDYVNLYDCPPEYKFNRVDYRGRATDYGGGWSFHKVEYHTENRRTLTKYFGLKIIVSVEGEGRRTDMFLLATTLGSFLGLFSVVSLICDRLLDLMNCLRKRNVIGVTTHQYVDRYGEEEQEEDDLCKKNTTKQEGMK